MNNDRDDVGLRLASSKRSLAAGCPSCSCVSLPLLETSNLQSPCCCQSLPSGFSVSLRSRFHFHFTTGKVQVKRPMAVHSA